MWLRNCISQNTFPDMWNKSNICPMNKKGDKQVINNCRPVSLLLICEKVFERLIFNSIYEYLEEHKILPTDQSGFWVNNSFVNQLLSIVHNIYSAFDAYPTLESRGAFWICPRLLIKYGMRDLFLNLIQWVFQMHYYNLLNLFWQTGSRELYWMVRYQSGYQ